MKVVFREFRRDGTVQVTLKDYRTGQETNLSALWAAKEKGGRRSMSAGVPLHQLDDAKRVDQKLGVNDEYEVRGLFAYKVHPDAVEERKWLRAHKWVNHNAGYRDPCPGDFVPKDQVVNKPGPRITRVGMN